MTQITRPRIINLVEAFDRATSPAERRQHMLDVARVGQVVTKQPYLIHKVAGPMAQTVSRVFGDLSTVFVLTCPKRRQVYFAVLAKLEHDGRLNDLDQEQRSELLVRLLSNKNDALIEYAYSSNPTGFVSIVTALGPTASPPSLYLALHSLVDDAPGLVAALRSKLQHATLSADMLAVLRQLPPKAESIELAAQFPDLKNFTEFLDTYRVLTGLPEISLEHQEKLLATGKPKEVLRDLYFSVPFPEPIIHGSLAVRHIRNGHELNEAAVRYDNCLACYVPEALNNDRQFYVFSRPDAKDVIFEIKNDHPFGWHLGQFKFAKNKRVPQHIADDLRSIVKQHGIVNLKSVEERINNLTDEEFPGLDEIEEVLDELMEI